MTDDFEDDPVVIEMAELQRSGLSQSEAWGIVRLREARAQFDAEATDWANAQVQAAWGRLVEAHPLFHIPSINDAF